MFAPPPVIETEVFASLPEPLRKTGQSAEWLRVQRRGAMMDSFLEGPSFDREGNLYVVDIPTDKTVASVHPHLEAESNIITGQSEAGQVYLRLPPAPGELTAIGSGERPFARQRIVILLWRH